MEYSIGEVSALLNISRDMIRYYEKQGAVKSCRNADNNYRVYDSMEVFWLMEAMQHKSWGIPIHEIADIRNHEYTSNTRSFIHKEALKLSEEAVYKKLLSQRLEEVESYMLLGMQNIGNFWVEHTKAQYRCHLVRSRGDEYDRINLSQEASRYIFSERMHPFFDSGLTAGEEHVDWEMTIRKKYVDMLGGPVPEAFSEIQEGLCLCTNVDIGEIGEFDPGQFHVLKKYASSHGYIPVAGSRIRGILLGRGTEKESFHRVVKLFLPII